MCADKAEILLTKLLEEQISNELEETLLKPMKSGYVSSVPVPNSTGHVNRTYQSGEENGIHWEVFYNEGWIIRVSKKGISKEKNIGGYEPRFGVDCGDSVRIEETLDKMLSEF